MTAIPGNESSELDIVRAALGAEYEISEELGRGGMAIVYRARERELERDVALKVLPFSLAFDADLVERFQREARTAAQLEHPNIIPIYRVGRSGQVIYFAMKYLRGESLSSLLERRGSLAPSEVHRILQEAGSALGYAARNGVVHRDVKPDNIMQDGERWVVTDFGIARSRSGGKLTAAGMTLGTPTYMSPEQARAKDVDGRSDLYSLGCVAYECLAGRPPFDADDPVAILMDHINAPLPRPTLRTAEERALFAVIERMLAKKPSDRYQTADELMAALDAAGHPGEGGQSPQRPGARQLTPTQVQPAPGVSQWPRYRARLDAAVQQALDQLRRAPSQIRQLGPGAWVAAMILVLTLTGFYYGAHYVSAHRSRCPTATAQPSAGSGTAEASLLLLMDPVAARPANSSLDVYYDVCGLDRDTPFRATVTVARNTGGLRRLLGGDGVKPVTVSHEEKARGPATRRHRSVSLEGLPPGSYTLAVSIVDNRGRRRDRSVEFQIRD